MSKETKTTNLIGARVDENDILNSMFTNDKDRIKFNSRAFATMSIAKAFAKTYGIELSEDVKKDKAMNTVTNIEVGQLYLGEVKEFDKNVFIEEKFPTSSIIRRPIIFFKSVSLGLLSM